MKHIISTMGFLLFLVSAPLAGAEVDVSISIGVPSPLVFAAPPAVVVVPSGPAYVYMVPGTPGLYFYNSFWYRFHGGRWYWAHKYNERWRYIETHLVPRYIIDVPPDYYRRLPPGYYRIPYSELDRSWYRWDKSRHWDRYDWYKREYREHERKRHGGAIHRDAQKRPSGYHRDLKHEGRGDKKGRGVEKNYFDDSKGGHRGR